VEAKVFVAKTQETSSNAHNFCHLMGFPSQYACRCTRQTSCFTL